MNTSLVGVDLPTKMISLLGLAPLRQDMLALDAQVFEDEIEDAVEDETLKGSVQPVTAKTRWLRSETVARRHASDQILESVKEHRVAVLEVKKLGL